MSRIRIIPKRIWDAPTEGAPTHSIHVLTARCYHCGREVRLGAEAVDGGEAEYWRNKHDFIVDQLDQIGHEVDTWFDVNPWREQANVVLARLEALIKSTGGGRKVPRGLSGNQEGPRTEGDKP
jgi:hypothetical protein